MIWQRYKIKSEKLTPFGGISSIMEQFDALLAQTIDSTLVSCYNSNIQICVFSKDFSI